MDIVSTRKRIDRWFPELAANGYEPKSDETPDYNCIAWAAGETYRRWDPAPGYYWPGGIPRDDQIRTLIHVFESLGYQLGDELNHGSVELEAGIEKVALYAQAGAWTHAARQLPDGRWTSKLGDFEDIEHQGLGGFQSFYGTVQHVMYRKMPS